MNKALFRDRAKKLMITGVLAGVIAGVAITSGISSITLKKAEKKLEISNAKLQEQTKKNEELQAELDKEEVTENENLDTEILEVGDGLAVSKLCK